MPCFEVKLSSQTTQGFASYYLHPVQGTLGCAKLREHCCTVSTSGQLHAVISKQPYIQAWYLCEHFDLIIWSVVAFPHIIVVISLIICSVVAGRSTRIIVTGNTFQMLRNQAPTSHWTPKTSLLLARIIKVRWQSNLSALENNLGADGDEEDNAS